MSGLFLNIVSSSADMARSAVPAINNLWAWGKNDNGQLGLNNTTTISSPVQVGALGSWTNVYICSYIGKYFENTFARKSDGTLWSWGRNSYGNLGHNDRVSCSSPTQIGSLNTWSSKFSPGGYGILAVKTNGTLWSWGRNGLGALGLGDTIARSSPVQVGALTTWATVSDSAAIKTDGTLWTWGDGASGQSGRGNTTSYSSPVQVGLLTDWSQLFSVGDSRFAIKTNGTLWSWGFDYQGSLGLNNTIYRSSPVQIGSLNTWASVGSTSASIISVIAVQTNGTLWTWGRNYEGQLGQNDQINRSSPTQVGALTTWTSVTAGGKVAGAIKSPGSLWTFGRGTYGTLGQNNTTTRSSPVQVGTATNWKTISMGYGGMALRS